MYLRAFCSFVYRLAVYHVHALCGACSLWLPVCQHASYAHVPLALQITCGDSEPVSDPGLRFSCPNGTEFNASAANLPAGRDTCCQVST
jgi:hypothetical protein